VECGQAARSAGFRVNLVYICAEPLDVCIRRVAQRVALGGHAVPDADIRRRYTRSLANLPSIISQVDATRLFDNSGVGTATLVAEFAGLAVVYLAPVRPTWIAQSLGDLLADLP